MEIDDYVGILMMILEVMSIALLV